VFSVLHPQLAFDESQNEVAFVTEEKEAGIALVRLGSVLSLLMLASGFVLNNEAGIQQDDAVACDAGADPALLEVGAALNPLFEQVHVAVEIVPFVFVRDMDEAVEGQDDRKDVEASYDADLSVAFEDELVLELEMDIYVGTETGIDPVEEY